MGNAIYATSALALAGAMAAGPASAADMLSVGVGGYMEQWVGMTSVDGDANDGGLGTRSDSEIHFSGKLESDSGLTFGMKVELEGNTAGDQVDESNLWVSGEFGRFVLGSEDDAGAIMHYGHQDVGVGLNAGDVGGWLGRAGNNYGKLDTFGGNHGDEQIIAYYTPRISGVQLGVSHAPNVEVEDTNMAPDSNANSASSVGLNFQGDMGGASVKFSAGYYSAEQTGMMMSIFDGMVAGAAATDPRTTSDYLVSDNMADEKAIADAMKARDAGTKMDTDDETKDSLEEHRTAAKDAADSIKDHQISAMQKADNSTISNFGLQVGFGSFSFNAAYATQNGGAYMFKSMPMALTEAELTARVTALNTDRGGSDEAVVSGGKIVDPMHQFKNAEGKMVNEVVAVPAEGQTAAVAEVNDPNNEMRMYQTLVADRSKDFDVMSVGAMYADGPLSVSIGHIRTEFDDGEDASASMLSASYTLAPGVAWKSSVFTGEDSKRRTATARAS